MGQGVKVAICPAAELGGYTYRIATNSQVLMEALDDFQEARARLNANPMNQPHANPPTMAQWLEPLFAVGQDPFVARDPDVLDTWFSSALWPLSTLGWPAGGTSNNPQDQLLNYFYPTSVLSTAREILSLWVARMVMFGLYLHGDVPFKQVYIHAVIQDGNGRPMKKSLGNGVDPVDIVESHGADALRYTLASMATETQDIRLPVVKDKTTGKNSSPRFDIGRNFANKIWNASRFILSNISDLTPPTAAQVQAIANSGELSDRWIISRCNQTAAASARLIGEFKFAELTAGLYQFFWNDLCDWYLEIAKARIKDKNPQVRIVLLFVLRQALAMLHPVMPFVTEALWEKVAPDAGLLITSPYPQADPLLDNPTAEAGMSHLQDVVRSIRDIRNQYNIDLKRQLAVTVRTADVAGGIISDNRRLIESLATATLADIGPAVEKPANAASAILPQAQVFVADVVDRDAEKLKLLKRRDELNKFLAANRAKLSNETFVSKAPAHIVQGLQAQTTQQEHELLAVEKGLAEL
ncbi:MAG: class I tRNA ligase family protein [Phycisphaerae bacterium]